jgi:Rieske Fe-S protein
VSSVVRTRRLATATVATVVAVVVAAVVAVVVALALTDPGTTSGTSVRFDRVPEGLSFVEVEGTIVWLDRDGDEVTALADDPNHLPGEALWWCPHDEVFIGPRHGEIFDGDGVRAGGPARRGLDRYATSVAGRTLTVDLDDREPGSGEFRSGVELTGGPEWDAGVGSFCQDAVRSPRSVDPDPPGGP